MRKQKKIWAGLVLAGVLLVMGLVSPAALADDGGSIRVTYQAEPGVSDLPADDTAVAGEPYTLAATVPQREGYEFVGWQLDRETEPRYRVYYDLTSLGVGEAPVDPKEYRSGDTAKVVKFFATSTDSSYAHWGLWTLDPLRTIRAFNDLKDCYEFESEIPIVDHDVTLYAVYHPMSD